VDQAVAGDEAIAVDDLLILPKVARAVTHELVGFNEGAFVEQEIDPLTRGQAASGSLFCEPLFTPSSLRRGMTAAQLL
jgi:hypothetical protein